jgi:hypothetical protein
MPRIIGKPAQPYTRWKRDHPPDWIAVKKRAEKKLAKHQAAVIRDPVAAALVRSGGHEEVSLHTLERPQPFNPVLAAAMIDAWIKYG